jgi:hypothetical protein
MNWRLKALAQAAIARLPAKAGLEMYYQMQRAWGRLRRVDPLVGFEDGLRLVAGIEATGRSVVDRAVVEVGTGRRINVPMAFWLCGAASVVTLDRNPYLKTSLIEEDLAFIRREPWAVHSAFGARAEAPYFRERLDLIVYGQLSVPELMARARIDYVAPADAKTVPLNDGLVDFHVSNNVLEHVTPDELRGILREGARLLAGDGVMAHRVDFSDHFAECDSHISSVNFLRFSDEEWRMFAGNRYAYHNRLRIDDLESVVRDLGLEIVSENAEIDDAALRALEAGMALDRRFAAKPKDVNATTSALMVMARPRAPTPARRRGDVRVSG